MFFPYRAQIQLHGQPLLTILLSILCIAVFIAQEKNNGALIDATAAFCEKQNDRQFLYIVKRLTGSSEVNACVNVMLTLYNSKDSTKEITELAQDIEKNNSTSNLQNHNYYEGILRNQFFTYRQTVPANLTKRLWYSPESWSVPRMLSATVAHGSLGHLIGNLIFFFAFSATLEVLLGPVLYVLVFASLSIGTHIVYSIAMFGQPDALPTLGLSGVIMGIIALFTYFLPHANIRCLLWLGIFIRRISLPAWLLTTWYVGWDAYTQIKGNNSEVNLIAHLAGAMIGLGIGFVFFRRKRAWAKELVEE